MFRAIFRALLFMALPAAIPTSAGAGLTFDLTFQSGISDNPKSDPHGAHLQRIVRAAAQRWEVLFPDVDDTIRVEFFWSNEMGTLLGHTISRSLVDNGYTIRFGPFASWFFDPTPDDDLEFLFVAPCGLTPRLARQWVEPSSEGRRFVRDLPTEESSNPWALDPKRVPAHLELSYSSQAGTQEALGRYDLLTTAIHELGHTLLWPSFDQVQRNGFFSMGDNGIRADSDGEHVALRDVLMSARYGGNSRRLPSELDARLVAAAQGWSRWALPRRTMTAADPSCSWGQGCGWDGGAPGPNNGAFILDKRVDAVVLDGNTEVRTLYLAQADNILDPITLRTGNHNLRVKEWIVLHGNLALPDDTALLADAGDVATEKLIICGGLVSVGPDHTLTVGKDIGVDQNGILRLLGGSTLLNGAGSLKVDFGALQLTSARGSIQQLSVAELGEVTGSGSIDHLRNLQNLGMIKAVAGSLSFLGTDDARFDLDGAGDSKHAHLAADGGDLTFDGELQDPMSGQLRIGPDRTASFPRGFSLDTTGRLLFMGGGTLRAPNADFRHGATVIAQGARNAIEGSVTFWNVWVEVSHGADLILEGPTTYRGGTYRGYGTLHQDGNAEVLSSTKIEVETFLWDGETERRPGQSTTTVHAGATLTITGALSKNPHTHGYDGQIIVEEGSVLNITQDWILEGTLHLNGGTVRGGRITNRGTVLGFGIIEAGCINEGLVEGRGGMLNLTGGCEGAGTYKNVHCAF